MILTSLVHGLDPSVHFIQAPNGPFTTNSMRQFYAWK